MEEFSRIKAGQPKKPSYKQGTNRFNTSDASEYDKGVNNHALASNIAKSYLALDDGDKENKRNLSNLVIDSSSGAIKYRGSVLTENARLKTLPQKSTPKLSHVPSKLKKSDINPKSHLDILKTEKEPYQINSNQYKPSKKRAGFDQLTPTAGKDKTPTSNKSTIENPLSAFDSSNHYTSAFYTKKSKAIKDADASKAAKNKSQGSICQSDAVPSQAVRRDVERDGRPRVDKSSTAGHTSSKKNLSCSGSKLNKIESSSKSQGRTAHEKEVNLYETGSQTNVNRFEIDGEGSVKKPSAKSRTNGYLLDSLKKVVIDDSGIKRKRSQLKMDDLQDIFEDDKQFIESTKKIKERIDSSNKKSQEDRILDYEPFNGRRLNFSDVSNVAEGQVKEVAQVLLEAHGTEDLGKSNLPKTVSYEKLKAQKRPLKSVDFVSIKNNLRRNRLVQGENGSRLASPTRPLDATDNSHIDDLADSRIDKLFSNNSVRKLKDRDHVKSRGRCTTEDDVDLESVFNKTSDAKFTFTDTTNARLKNKEKNSFISSHKNSFIAVNNFKKRILPGKDSSNIQSDKQSIKSYQKSVLAILEDVVVGCKKRNHNSAILKEYLSLAIGSTGWIESKILESPELDAADERSRKLVSRSLKVEQWAISVMYYLFTDKKTKLNSLVAVYLADLAEKVMKNFKFLLKTTRLSLSVSGLEDIISAEDLIDMLDFSTNRTQSILSKL
jgi:hypothetical protein